MATTFLIKLVSLVSHLGSEASLSLSSVASVGLADFLLDSEKRRSLIEGSSRSVRSSAAAVVVCEALARSFSSLEDFLVSVSSSLGSE